MTLPPRRTSFLLALLLPLHSAMSAEPWTIETAVATALRQSPDVQAARHRIEACEAMLSQANSAWQPQVLLSGGYTQTNNALTALMFTMNQRNFGPTLNFNRPGWVDNLEVSGTVVYHLYAGGQPTARRSAAQAGMRATEQDLRAAQLQLGAEVVKVMLNLRKARENVTALEAGLKAYDASLANSRLRFEAGQVLKADLLSLEVQTARTRETLSSARHAAALAARMFTFVLGGPPSDEPMLLADNDAALAVLAVPAGSDFSQRPELLRLRERVHMNESLVEAARGGNRPVVNAYVNGQYDKGWHFGRNGESLQAGLTMELNVFDGGRTSGRVRQAIAELAQAKDELRKAELTLGLEVERARLAYTDAQELLRVTTDVVAQAEESAALSRARFEKGVLLTSELIGSEGRLIEARLSRVLAAADERIALVELRRALGLPAVAQP